MPFRTKVSHRDNDTRSDAESIANNENDGKPETLKCFLGDATMHGARFLFAESFLRRFLWSLALLVCLSTCHYLAYQTIKEFFRRPFNTKITTKSAFKNELIFPAVTLCNFNSVNIIKLRHFLSQSNSSEEEIAKKLDKIANIVIRSNVILDNVFKERNAFFFDRNRIEAIMRENGHQIDEMLLPNVPPAFISCSFDGLLCGAENFTSFTSSYFGQCYTFNSGQNRSPLLKTTMGGKNSGLKLRLNIQRDSYVKNTKNPFVGVVVLMHDQNNFPFIGEYGIGVEPGAHTFFSIKMKKVPARIYNINFFKPNCLVINFS